MPAFSVTAAEMTKFWVAVGCNKFEVTAVINGPVTILTAPGVGVVIKLRVEDVDTTAEDSSIASINMSELDERLSDWIANTLLPVWSLSMCEVRSKLAKLTAFASG